VDGDRLEGTPTAVHVANDDVGLGLDGVVVPRNDGEENPDCLSTSPETAKAVPLVTVAALVTLVLVLMAAITTGPFLVSA
jgi:hypothetical protein